MGTKARTTRYLAVAIFMLQLGVGVYALSAAAEEEEDFTIVPGQRMGVISLGMKPEQVKEKAGNHDDAYSLPGGIKAELSRWKETDKITYTIRVFYDPQGRVIQVAESAPKPATADGISLNSSLADVTKKYKSLKVFKYKAKDARIDYQDDVARGITFEFTRAASEPESSMHLYAILVHAPGKNVIPDADEHPI
jgi:hypothetical protein